MSCNSFGKRFCITTWGESHGKAVGVVIDGCPAGVELSVEEINEALKKRAPGNSPYTSPRKEPDVAEIYSGIFEGKTTGAPISIIIPNVDADSSKYEPIKHIHRPGHASYTYQQKYGIYDYRGSGRASARETVCRVAAGAVAKKCLASFDIFPEASLCEVGGEKEVSQFPKVLEAVMERGDSVGGVVKGYVPSLPVGLGEPLFAKLEARLASAMLSLPASKGFEIGKGFEAAAMVGSQHNDAFAMVGGKVTTTSNHAGGTLGGISTGMPLHFKVAFKPTSSIRLVQKTVTKENEEIEFELPEGSRHDPCVAIRAVPVVEAMCALVLMDLLLLQQSSQL